MGVGAAYGKTILIGDQFVRLEVPAVVAALPYRTTAEVTRADAPGWTLADARPEIPGYKAEKSEQQTVSIDRILEVMRIDTAERGLRIGYGGDLLAGSGVGASAASCVSLARALDDEYGLGLSEERINHIGWEGEFAYHGVPSGVDNTASTYGGVIWFRLEGDRPVFEPIRTKEPVDVVLAASGVTADTSKLHGAVMAEKARDAALFARRLATVADQAAALRRGLEAGDLVDVGAIMSANHAILVDMGLSHEKLVHLCDLARRNGALGAKLTGGGRGGYMVALTPGGDLQDRVAAAMEGAGYRTIRASLGGAL